jgi:hypothetical protein
MQSPLIGCGKLATNGCGIWFDNEKGSVVNGATKNKIRALTGFRLWRRYRRQFWDHFFKGAFLPQKWDDLPPF